jgi:hypothetical protein
LFNSGYFIWYTFESVICERVFICSYSLFFSANFSMTHPIFSLLSSPHALIRDTVAFLIMDWQVARWYEAKSAEQKLAYGRRPKPMGEFIIWVW